MEKYLFTDGTNVVREVQSKEELHTLIKLCGDTAKARIWIANTCEWIPYTEFSKRSTPKIIPQKNIVKPAEKIMPVTIAPRSKAKYAGAVKLFFSLATGLAIFLVYNFTRVKWTSLAPLQITAERPANVPVMSVDSLIGVVETLRGQKLDKTTLTNLRIRNNWPDRIMLQIKCDRDSGAAGIKYKNIELSVDNSTGYQIDNVVVELKDWQNDAIHKTDTFHLNNIGYSALSNRILKNEYRGDSLSVSFLYIKARSFNFCYSFDKESNYGNLNDRWFCKE
ncbi:MAG: hypothetical protein ACSLE0_16830 [Chitinophagaceae bacterium]